MPVSRIAAYACAILVLGLPFARAQAPAAAKPAAHATAKAKPHPPAAATDNGFMHVDDWFSYGQTEADVEREAPGVQIKARDPHADDIVVYGVRQRRDFEDAHPDANLTSPQGLDAAQPVVPGIGDSCSYKSGCYDMDQVPLRKAASSLFGD